MWGVDNLARGTQRDGRYLYEYFVTNDTYSGNYNIVRHAGTTYALLDFFKSTGYETAKQAGLLGLEFLDARIKKLNATVWSIEYEFSSSVGTASLGLLAYACYTQATDDPRYLPTITGLANFIIHQQRPDGAFAGRLGSTKEELYYSAEAFLALAFAYEILGDAAYLASIRRALDFYYTPEYEYNNSAFIPWASSGCAKWYELTEDPVFLEFCFEMTDIQVTRQYRGTATDALGNRLAGYIRAQTVNTGVYLEGIGDALRVAKVVEDAERVLLYNSTLFLGLEWVLSLQYRNTTGLPCPLRAHGGFHRGFVVEDAHLIRNDYTQHALSALVRGLREFSDADLAGL
jgi:hypothetical protein